MPKGVPPTGAWFTEMWLTQLPQWRPPLSGGRVHAWDVTDAEVKGFVPPIWP